MKLEEQILQENLTTASYTIKELQNNLDIYENGIENLSNINITLDELTIYLKKERQINIADTQFNMLNQYYNTTTFDVYSRLNKILNNLCILDSMLCDMTNDIDVKLNVVVCRVKVNLSLSQNIITNNLTKLEYENIEIYTHNCWDGINVTGYYRITGQILYNLTIVT